MHDFSDAGIYVFALLAIPVGAFCAAVFALIAYWKRALKTYWFVILVPDAMPWVVVAMSSRQAFEFALELVRESRVYRPVPFVGIAILLLGFRYFVRHVKEKPSRAAARRANARGQ